MKELLKNKWFWGIIILVIILGIIACKNGMFDKMMHDGGMTGGGRRRWFPFFRLPIYVRPTYPPANATCRDSNQDLKAAFYDGTRCGAVDVNGNLLPGETNPCANHGGYCY